MATRAWILGSLPDTEILRTGPGNPGTLLGNIQRNGLPNGSVGAIDVIAKGAFVEARINLRYINQAHGPIWIRVTDANRTCTANDEAVEFWTMIPAP